MAKIIKAWDPNSQEYPCYQRDTLEFIRAELHQDSGDLVLDPRQIIENARQEAESKIREAYAEGLRRGTEAGHAKFAEAVGKAAESLESAATAMEEARVEFLRSLEPQVVTLATAIAERILRREPTVDPERVRTVVHEALAHLEKRERIVLKLNPADLAALKEHNITLLTEFGAVEDLEIIADDTVAPGGCVAQSEFLEVDAQMETQFQKIVDTLME
jgi:flagellar assembly protein FliH